MPTRRTTLILLAVAGLFALLAATLTRDNEPTYGHHTLSYWVDRNQEFVKTRQPDTGESESPRKAILAIGTNALPWLLKWIHYEPNPVPQSILNRVEWSFWSTRVGGTIMFGSGLSNSRAVAAVEAFGVLGTNAAPALNDLVLLMQDKTHPMTSNRATMALGNLGECAFSALAQALSDPKQRERQLVALELFEMSHNPAVGTNRILTLVISYTNDSDPTLKRYATDFLVRIAPKGQTNLNAQ